MAHCLSAFVCKDQENLNTLFKKGYYYSVENGYAIIAISHEDPNFIKGHTILVNKGTLINELKSLGIKQFISLETDSYESLQNCRFYNLIDKPKKMRSINEGLALLGVRKSQTKVDLFDTIHLGKYRSEYYLKPEHYIEYIKCEQEKVENQRLANIYIKWHKTFGHLTELELLEKTLFLTKQYEDLKEEDLFFKEGLTYYIKQTKQPVF